MRKLFAALTSLALLTLGILFTAPTAQASHANGICDGHWYQPINWGRACYRDQLSADPYFGYGQTQDMLSDGHCVVVQYNNNDGGGWHNIYNSNICYGSTMNPWFGWYLSPYGRGALWVRFVRGSGSSPGDIVTLENCYTGYRCPQPI